MASFRDVPVTDAAAHELLTEYFEYRAQGFPSGPFAYLRSYPRPEQFVPPFGVFLIVEHAAADVGCGGIRRIDSENPDAVRYEVKHLWVRTQLRGHGLGRALLTELERRALGYGGTELVLDTNASLDAAAGLYSSRGFVDIESYNDNPNATNWYSKALT
jgi:GNAT superfamily N-acetyltransferase